VKWIVFYCATSRRGMREFPARTIDRLGLRVTPPWDESRELVASAGGSNPARVSGKHG